MAKWKRFNKGDCPICHGVRKDCRQNEDNGIVHCRSGVDAPSGWRFLGSDKFGFGMFIEGVGESVDATEYQRRKAEDERQKAERERKRREKLPTMAQRHAIFTTKHKHLTQAQNADLLRRGLTQTEIDFCLSQGWFWEDSSWWPNSDGQWVKNPGYGIAAIDPLTGLIVGAQLATDSREPKYPWLLPRKTNLRETGQNPLACWVSPDFDPSQPCTINLSEGFLKSLVSALKAWRNDSQQIWVGSAGCSFEDAALARTLGGLPVPEMHIFWPDGGSVTNPDVVRGYQNTHDRMGALGRPLTVAWWGQESKKIHPDCDEFKGDEVISFISWKEFAAKFVEIPQQKTAPWIDSGDNPPDREKALSSRVWKIHKLLGQVTATKPQRQRVEPWKPSATFKTVIPDGSTPIGDVYQSLYEQGYKFILNAQGTGSGKTHTAGLLNPDRFGKDTALWYLTQESRNPSTRSIESNFSPMPVRHMGMIPTGKFTQNNNPVTRPILDPNDAFPGGGNCYQANKFVLAAAKGLKASEGESADSNPICKGCKLAWKCTQESKGDGAGFRFERREAMGKAQLRLNPLSAPAEIPDTVVGIWEEISQQLLPETREATLSDFNAQAASLRDNDPELESLLDPIVKELRLALSEKSKFGKRERDFAALVDATLPVGEADRASIARQVIEALDFSLEDALGDDKDLEQAPSQVLGEMLEILLMPGDGLGGFVIGNNKITLTTPNQRIAQICTQARLNIFLDATIEPEILCQKLGIQLHELAVIKSPADMVDNITHTQIIGFGQCGRNRAQSTNERLKALHAGLSEKLGVGGRVEIADYKGDVSLEFGAKIQHMSNSRGSNEIEGADVLIVHGLPKPNMGAIESEYLCIASPGYSFEQYYQRRVDDEIRQLAGRLRANRYPDRKFSIVWVTDESLPYKTQEIQAIDIAQEAGSTQQKAASNFFTALLEVAKKGLKITQRAIAQFAQCTQGRVSQWFAAHGGWGFWKGLLQGATVEEIEKYRSELDETQNAILNTLEAVVDDAGDGEALLECVGEMVVMFREEFGLDKLQGILQATSKKFKRYILSALLELQIQHPQTT